MMMEIIKEFSSVVDTSSVMGEQVLAWAIAVEAQKIQTTMLSI